MASCNSQQSGSLGTLYVIPGLMDSNKIKLAANFSPTNNIEIINNMIPLKGNKIVKTLNSISKLPAVFKKTDGSLLFDSDAIAYYISTDGLRGKTDNEIAEVLQWLNFASKKVMLPSKAVAFTASGEFKCSEKEYKSDLQELKCILNFINIQLQDRTFLVGDRITLADIAIADALHLAYKFVLDPKLRNAYQNVNRWFTTIVNQSKFSEIIPPFELCEEKVPLYQPAAGVSPNKQEVKLKKEPKNTQVLIEHDDIPMEPKIKDPLDALPASQKFDLDAFKRVYSNEPEITSIPYFWNNFDPETYSIWLGSYKYNEELKATYMSCNLISGMFQRLDKLRKNAFASVCLFGTSNDSTISGVWVWKGKKLAFPLSADWQVDYESYEWKQLDPREQQTKELVNKYFSWEVTDEDGRSFAQGKIFK